MTMTMPRPGGHDSDGGAAAAPQSALVTTLVKESSVTLSAWGLGSPSVTTSPPAIAMGHVHDGSTAQLAAAITAGDVAFPTTTSSSSSSSEQPPALSSSASSHSASLSPSSTPPGEAINSATGEINWDCPCLQGALEPPCGEAFKAAFACFVASTAEPKGMDCGPLFAAMQDCYRSHPEIYNSAADEGDDDGNDGGGHGAAELR